MLGLVDFVRAVRGTVRLTLRRIHPLAGAVTVAVVWLLALGSLLWVTREDASSSPSQDATSDTERSDNGTDDRDGSSSPSGRDGPDGARWETSTRLESSIEGTDSDDADDPAGGTDTEPDGSGGSVLDSPVEPGQLEPPSTGSSSPSWVEPDPTTTSPTTTPSTSGPTTSTTTEPPPGDSGNGGGLLGALLDLLLP